MALWLSIEGKLSEPYRLALGIHPCRVSYDSTCRTCENRREPATGMPEETITESGGWEDRDTVGRRNGSSLRELLYREARTD